MCRRWKSNPEYIAWKSTDQLIGRRVAKYVEVVQTPEGGGAAIRFEAMRRGWVTQKDITEDLEEMFVVRFPRMGDDFPVHKQVREDKERKSETGVSVGYQEETCTHTYMSMFGRRGVRELLRRWIGRRVAADRVLRMPYFDMLTCGETQEATVHVSSLPWLLVACVISL